MIHFCGVIRPCPGQSSSAGLQQPLQRSYGEWRWRWTGYTGRRRDAQLPPAPPAGREEIIWGTQKQKRRKEEVEAPPGWYVLPPPGSSPSCQSQPQELLYYLYLLLYNHSSASFCMLKLPICFHVTVVPPVPKAYPVPRGEKGQGLQV